MCIHKNGSEVGEIIRCQSIMVPCADVCAGTYYITLFPTIEAVAEHNHAMLSNVRMAADPPLAEVRLPFRGAVLTRPGGMRPPPTMEAQLKARATEALQRRLHLAEGVQVLLAGVRIIVSQGVSAQQVRGACLRERVLLAVATLM
jgi:hypothetical protein